MDPLNLAECAAVERKKAAARLPHSKKGRSKLRHYKELTKELTERREMRSSDVVALRGTLTAAREVQRVEERS